MSCMLSLLGLPSLYLVRSLPSLARQNAGQVNGLGSIAAFAEDALHMHEAAGVDGGYEFGAGYSDAISFGDAHGRGNRFELGRKRPTEATAFLGLQHVDQLEAFDLAQKPQRAFAQAQLTQPVTGGMVGHGVRESSANIGYAGYVYQELGELERALGQSFSFLAHRAVGKHLRIEDANHRRTGAGGANDILGAFKYTQESLGAGACLIPVSGVEGRLSTAGLILRESYLAADAAKDRNRVDGYLRQQLVDEARDKQ